MQLPAHAGVMVLNTVLFPQAVLPLHIFEPRYRAMLGEALDSHRMFIVSMRRTGTTDSSCKVAGLGLIRASVKNPNGTSNLILQGIARVQLNRLVQHKPFRACEFKVIQPLESDSLAVEALRSRLLELADTRIRQGFPLPLDSFKEAGAKSDIPSVTDFVKALADLKDTAHLTDLMACVFLRSKPRAMQRILEAKSVESRLLLLVQFMISEIVSVKPG